jgi:hypothetical protein
MSCKTVGFLSAKDARIASKDHSTIFTEICTIQHKIIEELDNKNYSVVVNSGTPMTSTGGIESVTVTNSGINYDQVMPVVTIDHPIGTGAVLVPIITNAQITGFTVTSAGTGYSPIPATVSSIDRIVNSNAAITISTVGGGGSITAFSISNLGAGYHVNNVVDFTGTSGTGASAVVSAIDVNGGITSLNIVSVGTGYVATESVSVTRTVQIDANLGLVINSDGEVESVNIVNGGQAYHVGDEVNVYHPSGTGASIQVLTINNNGVIQTVDILASGSGYQTVYPVIEVTVPVGFGTMFSGIATTNLLGGITGATITNPGFGYIDALPQITITDLYGSDAVLEAVVVSGGITDINIVNKGGNYSQNASVTITAVPTMVTGSGATATCVVEKYGSSIKYYNSWNKIDYKVELNDQIQYVLDYFQTLGYTIKVQVNPQTGNTIQWYLSW